jgi:hypothetical protein
LRGFEEIREALFDSCLPRGRCWSVSFSHSDLTASLAISGLKPQLVAEIVAILELLCDLSDLMQSLQWFNLCATHSG